MELIAKVRNPYIVEYKEAWVEKVSMVPCSCCSQLQHPKGNLRSCSFPWSWWRMCMLIIAWKGTIFCCYHLSGLLRVYCHWLLRGRGHVCLLLKLHPWIDL